MSEGGEAPTTDELEPEVLPWGKMSLMLHFLTEVVKHVGLGTQFC